MLLFWGALEDVVTAVKRLYSGRLLLHIVKIESRHNDLTLNGEMKTPVNSKRQFVPRDQIFAFTFRVLFIIRIFMPVSLIRFVLDSFYLIIS